MHRCLQVIFMSGPAPSQTEIWEDLCLATVSERLSWNANGVSLSSNDKEQEVKDSDGNLSLSVISETQGTISIQVCVSVCVHVVVCAPQIKAVSYYMNGKQQRYQQSHHRYL